MVWVACRSRSPWRSWAAGRPTSAAEPLTVPLGWTTRTSGPVGYSAQVPRLLRAEVVGNRSGQATTR
jgi:hypothetical protein